jgi:hypothetical protein
VISIKKIELFLFILFVIGAYVLPYEVVFIIVVFSTLIHIVFKGLKYTELKTLLLPFLLILIGLFYPFKNPLELVIKDIFYFFFPLFVFYFGYLFAYYFTILSFFRLIIKLSVLLSLLYLLGYNFFNTYESVYEERDENGVASYIVIFALFIKTKGFDRINKSKRVDILTILLFSFVSIISLSRTFILVFIILLIFGTGFIKFNKYFIYKFIFMLVVSCISIYLLVNIDNKDRDTFVGKIATSFSEIAISEYSSKEDINNNWRGFEAFIGIAQYAKGSTLELIFGQGFGKSAPLGFEMRLDENLITEIPKFHNGFITILLKTGIIGCLVYLTFFIRLIFLNLKVSKRGEPYYILSSQLIAGISAVILFATLIISGWLNKGTFLIFIFSLGFFINSKYRILKSQ